MAPPPEYDKEPKAPDKNIVNISDDSRVLFNNIKDQPSHADRSATSKINPEVENKHVETLDDGQLRALLDEAITYKCPKDREGKSNLFKELLEEVEQDEQCEAAARVTCVSGRGARRARGRHEHHSSLQDLVAAMAAESAPRRSRHGHGHSHHGPPAASVSARAHHGGSLPSGVDTSFLLGEEPARGGYLATVRCVNPPPLTERRVSASDDAPGDAELDMLTRKSKAAFPMTYTSRASLEIGNGNGNATAGRAITVTTASNQVDSAIPFSCITSPAVVSSCTTTAMTHSDAGDLKRLPLRPCYHAMASITGEASRAPSPPQLRASAPPPDTTTLSTPQQPRSVITSGFNGLPLARPSAADEHKKSLDENGNAVQGFSSPPSGSSQPKKSRRKKSSKNETVIKSHQIDGYQGNKDLNEVLRFIESNAESARGNKLGRVKHKDDADDKSGKKRSTERRKDKESKIKRATSMEELSRTKLEDLTDNKPHMRGGKSRWPDAPPAKAERRSWGEDARTTLLLRNDTQTDAPVVEPVPAAELTEFQTVTKKRKPRRRTDEAEREPAADVPRRARPPSPRARRISAPPSDRSIDSNDDMDSVHSLPAAPPPLPSAPLSHVSYADIARTRNNIPDLIESCNFYGEGEEVRPDEGVVLATPASGTDVDQYPALTTVMVRRLRDKTSLCVSGSATSVKEREAPAPDVVSDRRPPVILLDSAGQGRDMDGITFGFDIDEQLLGRADVVRDAEAVPGAVAVRSACGPLRYVPPRTTHTPQIHLIVDYVGSAWEDIVKCGSGKVRYYTE